MNVFIVFSIFIVIMGGVIFLLPNLKVVTFDDIDINNDTTVYVGLGETCISYNTKFTCLDDLVCVTKQFEQFETGICLPENTTILDYEFDKDYERLENPDNETIVFNPENQKENKIVNSYDGIEVIR